MPPKLDSAVAVITGASSGIGRETALQMARWGTRLVLASRGEAALTRVASECEGGGADTLAVPTDVTDPSAVDALGDRAVERFGSIDVWVNNAGVIAYGHFEDMPADAYRRVIETNLFGQIHGARVALRAFRRQRSGVLINLSSVWGRVPSPYVSAYAISKYGVRAFSECLRQELRDAEDIHVVTILPQSVETPIFRNAANFSGRRIRAVPPKRPAEAIANRIIACAEDPLREVTDGRAGRALELVQSIAPGLWSRLSPRLFDRVAFRPGSEPPTTGNLFRPSP